VANSLSVSFVGVNSEDSHVRTRPPSLLAGGFLETPHLTPKTHKGTVVTLYLWMGAKDSWADSNLTTTNLSWFPSNSIL
jgi:hypothetical protein